MESASVLWGIFLAILIYGAFARAIGMRILAFRSEWLDRPQLLNRLVKNALAIMIGMWIAWAYCFWLLIKLVFSIVTKG